MCLSSIITTSSQVNFLKTISCVQFLPIIGMKKLIGICVARVKTNFLKLTQIFQTLPIPLQGFTSADEPPPPSLSGIQLLWKIKVKSLCPPHTDMDFCGPLLELCAFKLRRNLNCCVLSPDHLDRHLHVVLWWLLLYNMHYLNKCNHSQVHH